MSSSLSAAQMREYLRKSIASKGKKGTPGIYNQNKLNGLLAEVELRSYLQMLGYGDKVSPGGWIARRVGSGLFGRHTVVFFPELVKPGQDYPVDRQLPDPPYGLHTICSTFHQIGIAGYFCAPTIRVNGGDIGLDWYTIQLGLPTQQEYKRFPECLDNFSERDRRYNFLRYNTDVGAIPERAVPEEFSKEHIRIAFQDKYLAEISDVDGILWGEQYTYPVEIKEKTVGYGNNTGPYFGLDVGPFVKLAFYAAKRGNLHSLFIVREINDVKSRELINWWAITFERLAGFASWVLQPGGTSMTGGVSAVIKVPKSEFEEFNKSYLDRL